MNTSAPVVDNLIAVNASPRASAVSWAAIFAGAAAAAAVSLILIILGTGLGLSVVSPWDYAGISAAALGVSTVLWLTFTQLVASGLGGYLAGRLRVRWPDVHADEVFFRDTAHGLLSWAVASLLMAMLFASTFTGLLSAGVKAGAAVAGAGGMVAATTGGASTSDSNARHAESSDVLQYWADSLLRGEGTAPTTSTSNALPAATNSGETLAAITRIFTHAQLTDTQGGALSREDVQHLGRLIAQRSGLSQEAAEQRVTETYAQLQAQLKQLEASAKEAAEKARQATAYASLWLFITLLVGAFVASLLATMGGRQRDR